MPSTIVISIETTGEEHEPKGRTDLSSLDVPEPPADRGAGSRWLAEHIAAVAATAARTELSGELASWD